MRIKLGTETERDTRGHFCEEEHLSKELKEAPKLIVLTHWRRLLRSQNSKFTGLEVGTHGKFKEQQRLG